MACILTWFHDTNRFLYLKTVQLISHGPMKVLSSQQLAGASLLQKWWRHIYAANRLNPHPIYRFSSKTDEISIYYINRRLNLIVKVDSLSGLTVNTCFSPLACIPTTCNCSECGRGHYSHAYFSLKNEIKSCLPHGFLNLEAWETSN